MNPFSVGQMVVCLNDDWMDVRTLERPKFYPKKDHMYEVAGIEDDCIIVAEFSFDYSWVSAHFAPVEENEEEINAIIEQTLQECFEPVLV